MPLSRRFERALAFAARLHSGQVRKGTDIPYVAHLLAVASLALEHGATEDEAIAALLHDAIEDQGGPQARTAIRRRFGRAVADMVDGCSDCDTKPKPPWKDRKTAYIRRIPEEHASVRLISLADKLHNARSTLRDLRAVGDGVWTRFNGGKDGTLWYFRALVTAFRGADDRRSRPLVEELDRVVSEMERLAGSRRRR